MGRSINGRKIYSWKGYLCDFRMMYFELQNGTLPVNNKNEKQDGRLNLSS